MQESYKIKRRRENLAEAWDNFKWIMACVALAMVVVGLYVFTVSAGFPGFKPRMFSIIIVVLYISAWLIGSLIHIFYAHRISRDEEELLQGLMHEEIRAINPAFDQDIPDPHHDK